MTVRTRRVNRALVYPGLNSRQEDIEMRSSYAKQKMVTEINGLLRVCCLLIYTIFMIPFAISLAYNLIVPLIIWNTKKVQRVARFFAFFPCLFGMIVNPPLLFFVLVKFNKTKEREHNEEENHVRNLNEFFSALSFSMAFLVIGFSSRILFECASTFIYLKFTVNPNCGRHRCPLPNRLDWAHIRQIFSHPDWDLVTFNSRRLLRETPGAVVNFLSGFYFGEALELTLFQIVANPAESSLEKYARILRPYNFLIVVLHLIGLLLFEFEAFYFWQFILPKGARQLYYSSDYLGRVLDTIASLFTFLQAKSNTL